jgi:phosphatidylinositol-3-phosphatase
MAPVAAAFLVAGCARARATDACVHSPGTLVRIGSGSSSIRTVFVIVMENRSWSAMAGNASAPYINNTVIPASSYAMQYFGVRHPSEPNYLWLEGGTDYGVVDDADPASHHLGNKDHLVSLLDQAGISWKAYEEGIDGTTCPLQSHGFYAAKHDPFVFFDDVTGDLDPLSANCIRHIRPLPELATDLQTNEVPRYAFITPDLCNDMHGASGCPDADPVQSGDRWLAQWIPRIQAAPAYASSAVVITWDEDEGGTNPIGLLVLSPFARGGGYSNSVRYTHSSLLRSLQEIFGTGPLLCDAAAATPLSDLFRTYP